MKVLLIIFTLVFVGALSELFYLQYFQKEVNLTSESSPTPTPTATAQLTPISDPGVTWITPQIMDDLGLFKIDPDIGVSEVKYYKVANLTGGGEIVLAELAFSVPAATELARIRKNAEGKYFYLAKHSYSKNFTEASSIFTDKLQFDETTSYQTLSIPDFITISKTTLEISSSDGIFSNLKNPKEIGASAYGKVYKTGSDRENTSESDGISYDLKLVDSTYRVYTIKAGFITDDDVAEVTWSDFQANASKYSSSGYVVCGAPASTNEIVNTSNISTRLKELGATEDGEKIYTVAATDPVMMAAYENYKVGRNSNIDPIAAFATKKPIFIWQAGLGDFVIFTGSDFAALAECGA